MPLTREQKDKLLELVVELLRIEAARVPPERKQAMKQAWRRRVEETFPAGYDRMSATIIDILRAKDSAEVERILDVA